jgi:hypothetical protein
MSASKVVDLFGSNPGLQRQLLAVRLRLLASRVERLSDDEMRVLEREMDRLNVALFLPESLR